VPISKGLELVVLEPRISTSLYGYGQLAKA